MTWDPSMRAPESRLDRPDELLAAFGNPVAPEVLRVLRDGGAPRVGDIVIEFDELRHKHRVYRVRAAADGWARSLIEQVSVESLLDLLQNEVHLGVTELISVGSPWRP